MSEWHITPDYIVNNWTDELFDLMVEKLVDRKDKEKIHSKPKSLPGKRALSPDAAVQQFSELGAMGSRIKVVKKHGD